MATLEKDLKEGRARTRAAPAAAEAAAGCADEMMERLLSEGAEASEARRQGVPAGSGGGLLDSLLPAGPPLSFAPQESSTVVVSAESVTRETQKREQITPELPIGKRKRLGTKLNQCKGPRCIAVLGKSLVRVVGADLNPEG